MSNIYFPGIKDKDFVRGDAPMTKQSIRAITMSKLKIQKDSVIWDIGAGTGSVSVECALLAQGGKVYAIEQEHEGFKLIKENAKKFGLNNIEGIKGQAPEALIALESPDRIFIGGSGGKLNEVIAYCAKRIKDNGMICANFIIPENYIEAERAFKAYGFTDIEVELVNIAVGHTVKDKTMFKANNPVYILSAKKE